MSEKTVNSERPVKSPCVSVCALNAQDVCEGCFRTGSEITRWTVLDNEERRSVLRSCLERARQMGRLL